MLLFGNTGWTSPYVLSSYVALREKGLPFEVKEVDLARGEHHQAAFAQTSLTTRVPALVDGDFRLTESSAIVEYLEEAYPAPAYPRILPEGVRARAQARQIMAWIRSDLMPLREERSSEYVFHPHDKLPPLGPLSPAGERSAAKLLGVAEQVVPAGAGPLFGDYCAADTDLAMMLQRLVKNGHPVPGRIRDYANTQWERQAVREFRQRVAGPFAAK